MATVIALSSFDHGGNRRRGSKFSVSDRAAKDLARAGLVRVIEQHPATPDGAKLSASPAGQASPQTIVNESESGDTVEQAEPETPTEPEATGRRSKKAAAEA